VASDCVMRVLITSPVIHNYEKWSHNHRCSFSHWGGNGRP